MGASQQEQGPLRVALLGCGVVGSEVARLLTQQSADLAAQQAGTIEPEADRAPA